jgi:type IV pilus assembly protein PilA
MRRSWLVGLSLLVVVIAAVAYSYLSPRLTLDSIRSAAKTKDVDRLRELIDFDSVKANLKDDVKARLMASLTKDTQNNPFAGLGLLLVNAMVDPMIDAMISPAGLSALVNDGRVEGQPAEKGPSSAGGDAPNLEQGYVSYSLYRVKIGPPESPADGITITLRRDGFATWRLSRLTLPESAFALMNTPSLAAPNSAISDSRESYAIRAKVSEIILAMSICRTAITDKYQVGGTPAPGANNWGCEADARGSKYLRSITTDADGMISATVQGINPSIDGSVVTLIPLSASRSKAAVSNDFGKGLWGWLCGGTGTTLGQNHLPSSCRGS